MKWRVEAGANSALGGIRESPIDEYLCREQENRSDSQVKAQSQGWDKDSQWAEVLEAEVNQEGFWE